VGHGVGGESAIIEVKICPRSDIAEIHAQVTSYFAKGVTALATVVITDNKDLGWKDEYERKCLAGKIEGSRRSGRRSNGRWRATSRHCGAFAPWSTSSCASHRADDPLASRL
jgi:hypothetical protein